MSDFVFWSWVVCGIPLVLALVQRASEWSCSAIRDRTIARGPAVPPRRASDSSILWTHV
jgi:hypothetical protein